MTPNEYKEAAESLLEQAKDCATRDFGSTLSVNRVRSLTDIARVYAMLAAIPDTTVQDSVPFDTGWSKQRVLAYANLNRRRPMVDTDDDTTPSEAEALAIQHRHLKAELARKEATGACMEWGCSNGRRSDSQYCDGHDRDTVG